MSDDHDRLMVREHNETVCPFCGRVVTIGYLEDVPVVVHESPMCPTYEHMDSDDFVNRCVETLTQRRNHGLR